jgi:pre-mRNA-splicing factor CWC22
MRNQWQAFDDDDEVEIPKTTSNPTRKIKKKIRKKEQSYEKKPSPELYNEILQLKKQLKKLTTEPVRKKKKKKFKKNRIDKAQKANEKKRKREKERAARYNEQYNRWQHEEYEKHRERLEAEERQRMYQEQQRQLKQMQFISSLPEDIIDWMAAPDKKGYYKLMKKYHPDKNNNKENDYAKFITSYWDTVSKI